MWQQNRRVIVFNMYRIGVGRLIVAMGCFFLLGAWGEPIAGPSLSLSTTVIDLGTVKPVDGPPQVIEVRNTGTESLRIDPILTLCTCVEVDTPSMVVAPGETGSFSIRTLLATYPGNDVHGKVRLYSNDLAQPEVDITVRAEITPEYIIEPSQLDFGTVKAGVTASHTFIVQPNGDTPVQVERVVASRGFTATVEEIRPKNGETKDRPRPYRVTVTLAPGADAGPIRGTVSVFTNCPRIPYTEIKVHGRVDGLDYSVTPNVLAFGTAKAGELLGTFLVEGEGIDVIEARCENTALKLTVSERPEGTGYQVEVRSEAHIPTGRLLETVTLVLAEDELSEEMAVRVFGRIE